MTSLSRPVIAEGVAVPDRMCHGNGMIALESVGADTFAPWRGTQFQVHPPTGAAVSLTLVEVRTLGHKRSGALRDPFALTFHGPNGWQAGQGMFRITHAELGELEIFLVQVEGGAGPAGLEAIFT